MGSTTYVIPGPLLSFSCNLSLSHRKYGCLSPSVASLQSSSTSHSISSSSSSSTPSSACCSWRADGKNRVRRSCVSMATDLNKPTVLVTGAAGRTGINFSSLLLFLLCYLLEFGFIISVQNYNCYLWFLIAHTVILTNQILGSG